MKILIIILVLLSYCKKNQIDLELDKQVEEIQNEYRKKLKENYSITNISASKEEAIEKFLNAISKGDNDSFLFNKSEYLNIFLPNSIDEKTLVSRMDPEKAWEITQQRRENGITNLRNILYNKKFKIKSINWKSVRELNTLKGHVIGNIEITIDGKNFTIDEVKLVIERSSEFKVCVVSK